MHLYFCLLLLTTSLVLAYPQPEHSPETETIETNVPESSNFRVASPKKGMFPGFTILQNLFPPQAVPLSQLKTLDSLKSLEDLGAQSVADSTSDKVPSAIFTSQESQPPGATFDTSFIKSPNSEIKEFFPGFTILQNLNPPQPLESFFQSPTADSSSKTSLVENPSPLTPTSEEGIESTKLSQEPSLKPNHPRPDSGTASQAQLPLPSLPSLIPDAKSLHNGLAVGVSRPLTSEELIEAGGFGILSKFDKKTDDGTKYPFGPKEDLVKPIKEALLDSSNKEPSKPTHSSSPNPDFDIHSPAAGKVVVVYRKPNPEAVTAELVKYLEKSLGNFKQSSSEDGKVNTQVGSVQETEASEDDKGEVVINLDALLPAATLGLANIEVTNNDHKDTNSEPNLSQISSNIPSAPSNDEKAEENPLDDPKIGDTPPKATGNKPPRPRPEYGIQSPKKPDSPNSQPLKQETSDPANPPGSPNQSSQLMSNILNPFSNGIFPGWMIPSINWPSFSRIFQRIFNRNRFNSLNGQGQPGPPGQTPIPVGTDDSSNLPLTPVASPSLRLGIDTDCVESVEEKTRDEDNGGEIDTSPMCQSGTEDKGSCNSFCVKNGFGLGSCVNQEKCVCQLGEDAKFGLVFKTYEAAENSNLNRYRSDLPETLESGKCKNCPCSSKCQKTGAYIGYCGNVCYCGIPWHDGTLSL